MRTLFIGLVILVFVAYCGAVNKSYTLINVPSYVEDDVHLLGGKTVQAWNDNATFQTEYLGQLEVERYQPVTAISVGEGEEATVFAPSRALTAKDYIKIIAHKSTGGADVIPAIKLMNPSALYGLEGKRYVLRNNICLPCKKSDGKLCDKPLLKLGTTVTKDTLDVIINANKTAPEGAKILRISSNGIGNVVATEPGTMVMVMIIFLALVAALKTIMWEPVIQIIDARKKDVEDGATAGRKNRIEEKRIDDERRQLFGEARREYLAKLSKVQMEAMKEADVILKGAKTEVHRLRDAAAKDLSESLGAAEQELRGQIPAFAQEIATSALGRPISQKD